MSLAICDLASHRATAGAGVSATSYFLSQYRARTATAMKYAVVVIASITSSYQPAGAGARGVASTVIPLNLYGRAVEGLMD